jgi:hypothetical protein
MYFIYFIKVAENIKIGICKATLKHLKQRLSEANRWYPNSKILGILTIEDKEIEKRIHLHFKDNNINSEVFKLDKRMTRFIFDYCDWTPNKRFYYCSEELESLLFKLKGFSKLEKEFGRLTELAKANKLKWTKKASPYKKECKSFILSLNKWCLNQDFNSMDEYLDRVLPVFPEPEKEYFNYHNNDTYWSEIGRYGLG